MSEIDQYAVIGHPIEHSKSPRIHAAFAKATSQRMSYEPLLAPLDGLEKTWVELRARGGRGANITVPFKQEALALCDQLSERAQQAGAVNTLSLMSDGQVRGDNTDGAGLVRDIAENAGWSLAGQRVLELQPVWSGLCWPLAWRICALPTEPWQKLIGWPWLLLVLAQ